MAYPPTLPPNNRTNATPLLDAHAADHNMIVDALSAILAHSAELAYVEQTAVQTNIQTTAVDLTGLSVTFTLATQRRVQLDLSVWFSKAAPDTAATAFAQIANAANAEQQGGGAWCGAPGQTRVHLTRSLTLPAGTYTYKGRANTGAGFLNTASNASEPSILKATDLGPA